jgi:hypothetical protein
VSALTFENELPTGIAAAMFDSDRLVGEALDTVLARTDVAAELEALHLSPQELLHSLAPAITAASEEASTSARRAQQLEFQLREATARLEADTPDFRIGNAVAVITAMALGLIFLWFVVGGVSLALAVLTGTHHWIFPRVRPEVGVVAASVVAGLYGATRLLGTRSRRRLRGTQAAKDAQFMRRELANLRRVTLDELADESLLPEVTRVLNAAREPSYDPHLLMTSATGLGEPLNPRFEIATEAKRAIERRLTIWSGASIGVAGPRGIGKTTLLQALCRPGQVVNDRPILGVLVSAPVRYEPRDFILYLSGALCETVLTARGLPAPKMLQLLERPALPRAATRLRLVDTVRRVYIEPVRRALFGEDTTALDLGGDLAADASDLLQEIRFQQTFTSGWSGGITSPVAAKLDRGQSFVRASMTLPDVVSRFRAFVERVSQEHKVVIGIDEMDKIGSDQAANAFLNDIKAVFGARECFFLLSVSEDAMSAFERRGLPVRDAFDSALDDVVAVGYLDFGQSMEMLSRRVIGLPRPFHALCHVLGGGLPRDVLRVARGLAELHSLGAGRNLGGVALDLVSEDIKRKVFATDVATRRLAESPAAVVRSAAQSLSTTASELEVACSQTADELSRLELSPEEMDAVPLMRELVGYAYFLTAVVASFGVVRDEGRAEALVSQSGLGSVDGLARCRQAFVYDVRVAWDGISEFRNARGLPHFPYPFLAQA